MTEISTLGMGPLESIDWAAYFAENQGNALHLDFTREKELEEKLQRLIFPSIQAFQAGEASDGSHLLGTVQRYVKESGDTAYGEAMKWFVAEENRHSRYLKRYMDHYGVGPSPKPALDRCFRRLRRLGGLKGEVTVLVTAEIIALSYYSALSACTPSPVLQAVCGQMLRDELRHIVFQSYTLYKLGRTRSQRVLRTALMRVVLTVVWLACREVFCAGGYPYRRFASECMGYLRQSIRIAESGKV